MNEFFGFLLSCCANKLPRSEKRGGDVSDKFIFLPWQQTSLLDKVLRHFNCSLFCVSFESQKFVDNSARETKIIGFNLAREPLRCSPSPNLPNTPRDLEKLVGVWFIRGWLCRLSSSDGEEESRESKLMETNKLAPPDLLWISKSPSVVAKRFKVSTVAHHTAFLNDALRKFVRSRLKINTCDVLSGPCLALHGYHHASLFSACHTFL